MLKTLLLLTFLIAECGCICTGKSIDISKTKIIENEESIRINLRQAIKWIPTCFIQTPSLKIQTDEENFKIIKCENLQAVFEKSLLFCPSSKQVRIQVKFKGRYGSVKKTIKIPCSEKPTRTFNHLLGALIIGMSLLFALVSILLCSFIYYYKRRQNFLHEETNLIEI